jgi:predicted peptidase
MSQEYSFSLPYVAFDLELIGLSRADVGGADFSEKVSEFFASQFATFGGKARVVLNDAEQTINVTWTKGD